MSDAGLGIALAVDAAGATVIVNTVVLVRAGFGMGAAELRWSLAAYGAGSMVAALVVPRLLDDVMTDRTAMMAGAGLLIASLLLGPLMLS